MDSPGRARRCGEPSIDVPFLLECATMSLGELSIDGRLARPGDPDWDEARGAWNLAADQRPAAVAFVESAAMSRACSASPARTSLKVTAQGTGHGAGPLAELGDTILIKTERMRAVDVDAGAQTARLEAGVLALELGEAAQMAGLCSLPGSAPDVGVVGFTLGGGLGWLGRRYGFACNRVIAIELVTVDGEIRRVDAHSDSDLFWALRGGGGGYAIVTALHVKLLPIAELYAGMLILPAELGGEAIRAYREWAAGVSEEVTSIVRFLRPPPLPDVPEPLRDRAAADDRRCVHRHPGGGRARDRAAARDRRADHGHVRGDTCGRSRENPHGPGAASTRARPPRDHS